MATPEDPDAQLQHLLDGDTFEGETFTGLCVTAAMVKDKEFFRCVFERCQLQESQWKDCLLESVIFRGCDLTRAQWQRVGLRGVRFEGSKLMGINWSSVSPIPEVAFEECNLRYATFEKLNLRKTPFSRCSVREVNLLECDLSDADFTGSDLSGTTVRGCTLARADLSTTTGAFLDPARNRVKDARVSVETAVALAESLGMRVAGHGDPLERPRGPSKR